MILKFIPHEPSKNYDRRQIEQELSKKGWIKQEDQEMAIQAANSMLNIVRDHTAG